jgi:diguanylate cyclase (GGDEF)-like protein
VGVLAEPVTMMAAESTCSDLDREFARNPGATSVVIERPDRLLLIDRSEFEFLMSGSLGYGRMLYERTPIHKVFSDNEATRIPADTDVLEAYELIMSRGANRRFKDVLVEGIAEQRFGVLSAAAILDEVARANAREAMHDSLTGLANRTLLLEWLEHGLNRPKRDRQFALLFIDLDRFKIVNDSIGHGAGDDLLIGFAERLMSVVRPTDAAARLGGDEFALLLDRVDGRSDAAAVARRLLDTLRAPFPLEGRDVVLTASIGIVMPEYGDDVTSLLRKADIAMYDAKRAGGNRYHYFQGALADAADRRLDLEMWLRRAVEQGSFVVQYHPIVEADSLRLTGFEALVRGVDADGSLVAPSEFLGVAEETGLIVEIDRIVVQQAACLAREWEPADDLTISVNLSPELLNHRGGLERINDVISAAGLDPRALLVEITEGSIVQNLPRTTRALQALRDRGVRVAIDDFGTGYSSLAQLSRLPFDRLKIDRAFIARMVYSEPDAAIVRLMIAFARALELEAIAEGVETDEQLAMLRGMGCFAAQGFLFSRPVGADVARAIVSAARSCGGTLALETVAAA